MRDCLLRLARPRISLRSSGLPSPSFPAKAGNPVRRGLSAITPASGILGHPPARVTTTECKTID